MPQFYFHLDCDDGRTVDDEGSDCLDLDAARSLALRTAADVAADDLRRGIERVRERITIVDDGGSELLSVAIDASLSIVPEA